MDERGHILPRGIIPAEFHGLFTVKARKLVVAKFDELNVLAETEKLKIEQPFGDRSGVVIEPMLTDQWFVDAEKMAKQAIAKVDDGSTKFVPENWKKTYDHWMKDIQPWCISRQLWWGHQIPAWFGAGGMGDLDSIDKLEVSLQNIGSPTGSPIVGETRENVADKLKEIYENCEVVDRVISVDLTDNTDAQQITVSALLDDCLLYTSPSPRDQRGSRMPSSA